MEKIKQYLQNININREYFSLRFFIAGAILSIAFFLSFINLSKTYTSSIMILVNAKSEIAAEQERQIGGNIIEFPKTLAFYDRLLKYNPDVRDIAAEKSEIERKEAWNDMLSVKKVGKDSSLIKISITTNQKNDSEQLIRKTVETLFHFTAFYYNIKNDVDLRIIEGPISHPRIIVRPLILLINIFFGFLVAFILQYIILKREELLISIRNTSKKLPSFNLNPSTDGKPSKNIEQEIKSLEDLYLSDISMEIPILPQENRNDTITAEIKEMKKLTKTIEQNKYPNFSEIPKQSQTKTNAPDNLPIADASFYRQSYPNINQQPKNISSKEEPMNQNHMEPSAEQLKERLNKLLRGEI